jgi:hypothetical protein
MKLDVTTPRIDIRFADLDQTTIELMLLGQIQHQCRKPIADTSDDRDTIPCDPPVEEDIFFEVDLSDMEEAA